MGDRGWWHWNKEMVYASLAILLVVGLVVGACMSVHHEQQKVLAKWEAEQAAEAKRTRHVYVIAAVSGQVLIYSTAQGAIEQDEQCVVWTDTKGIEHRHYISGGQVVHVSDQPIVAKGVVMSIEMAEPNNTESEAKP